MSKKQKNDNYLLDKTLSNLYNQELDKRSQELYDKNYNELEFSEKNNVNQYIYDIQNPQWKPVYINGNISQYDVNKIGDIKNRLTGKILRKFPDKQGYLRLTLLRNGIQYTFKIHRLVSIAFIPNPENKPEVNHINGKKWLNWVGNLEWMTGSENVQHAIKNGLKINIAIGEKNGTNKYTNKQIHQVCKLLEDIDKDYKSISNETNVSYSVISKIATGKLWSHISKYYTFPNRSKR